MEFIDAAGAFNRFGLGPRPGDLALVDQDIRSFVASEIADRGAAMIERTDLPDRVAALAVLREYIRTRRRRRQEQTSDDMGSEQAEGEMAPEPTQDGGGGDGGRRAADRAGLNEIFGKEIEARVEAANAATIGFTERLVSFWSNHFAVETDADQIVRVLAGALEREAIRPHVLGRFEDMLLAVTRHPAMLAYLNNQSSVGPNSRRGRNSERGLNENHARELLELHTVGVNGGYTQEDVTELARILTGWRFEQEQSSADFGNFAFLGRIHEPGDRIVMGVTYPDGGVRQGEAVIADLARHPSTAQHIAGKLARHFVADSPPQALSDRLAAVFQETDGDLQALALALLESDEAWAAPATKLKSPQEYFWSSLRALQLGAQPRFVNDVLRVLGQPLWNPPSPAGFSDQSEAWLAPDALTNRLDVAEQLATRVEGTHDPRALAKEILGPGASAETTQAIERAEASVQGLALLLMSPEFQRR